MTKIKSAIFLSTLILFTVSSVSALPPSALFKVGTYKDMKVASDKDDMTPDHIPSGAAIVVTCYLADGNKEENLPKALGDLYKLSSSPYYHVYWKANTVVYDTQIHRNSSRTNGQTRDTAILDGKDLKAAFKKDKDALVQPLLTSQKQRDANDKPTTKAVTSQEVNDAFKNLDALNTSSGIYDAAKIKTFCKK
jgi:hypothetical protein